METGSSKIKKLENFAGRYKDFIDNDIFISVGAYMSVAKIHSDLLMMAGEFDEAVEYYNFEEWLLGGVDDDVAAADEYIECAESALERMKKKAWGKVAKNMQALTPAQKESLFGKAFEWDEEYSAGLYDMFDEWGEFPYSMDDAFSHFCKVVAEFNSDTESNM